MDRPEHADLIENVQSLVEATQNMGVVMQVMRENSQDSSQASKIATEACDKMQSFIQSVSHSVSSMSQQMLELVEHSNQVLNVSQKAMQLATESHEIVEQLNTNSRDVSKIIQIINSIASQTKMLALNATIEAARAGNVGKGFAVVASEIKTLAKETTDSTEDISEKIAAMQSKTTLMVENISSINTVISELNNFQHSVTDAIEEQSVMSADISKNMQETEELSKAIAEQSRTVENSSNLILDCLEDSVGAIEMLAGIAGNVKDSVEQLN